MVRIKKKKIRSAAYHTKSYTIEEIVSIPYDYVCEHCGKQTIKDYKIRKRDDYTVMIEKGKDGEYVPPLDLPQDIIDQTYQKFEGQIQQEIELLKTETSRNKFAIINDGICDYCRNTQSWKAKSEYWVNVAGSLLVGVVIIILGLLFGLIFKGVFRNLSFDMSVPFFKYLFSHGVLFGFVIGFVIAAIYFLIRLNKHQHVRYQAENVDKNEVPNLHFDQIKVEKKIYETLKENRMK